MFGLFDQVVRAKFREALQIEFGSGKEAVLYYKEHLRAKYPWAEVARELGMAKTQAYKFFINPFSKAVLEPWPPALVQQVMAECSRLFRELRGTARSEKALRELVVDELDLKFALKSLRQHHYESMYFRVRTRVKQMWGQGASGNIDESDANFIRTELARILQQAQQ